MSDAIHFDIELGDLISGPAHKAAKAVDDLSSEFDKAKGKLSFLEQQLKLADKLGDIAGHEKYAAAVAHGSQRVFELGDALGQAKDKAKPAASALEQIAEKAPGLAKVAIAVAAVAVAFATVAIEIGKAGVETALEVTAMNASLEATFQALGKGPDAGKKTIEMVDDVARALPQSRDELAKWTREIMKMGVTDLGAIRQELLATASAQAILGEGGDAAFGKISRKVHDAIDGHHKLTISGKELTRTIGTNLADAIAVKMGMSLERLEQQLKAGTVDATKFGNAMEETFIERGGGGLDAMWMNTGRIVAKLKHSFGELFSDVDTKPLTDAMRGLLELFDQAQPSGEGMKTTFTSVFNSLVKDIAWAIVEGEVMFLELEVFALSTKLAFKPLLEIIKDIGAALNFVGTAIGAIKPPGSPAEPPKSVQEMKFDAVSTIVQGPLSLLTKAVGESGIDIGNALSSGMIVGIIGALGLVKQAGHQAGEAGAQGAREGAQVHSPSELTKRVGAMMSEGLAIGMVDSSGMPERAGRQISGAALGGMTASAMMAGAANDGAGGRSITISGLTIHITAPQGVTDANALSATGLVVALERLQLASGR